jgi:hypothetical protein
VGEARVIENWLEVSIGDGWIAAYLLAHTGTARRARTRILEVRIFPDEGDRVHPSGMHAPGGRWSAAFLGERARTKATFSFDRMRRGVTGSRSIPLFVPLAPISKIARISRALRCSLTLPLATIKSTKAAAPVAQADRERSTRPFATIRLSTTFDPSQAPVRDRS